jgi:hypothetical protein
VSSFLGGCSAHRAYWVQIDVLRRLNYRGANIAKIPDDKVVEELLKA